MAYVGQPIPSTVVNINAAKFSDGKSVRVTVPVNTTIEAGIFYLLDGFLGVALQSVQATGQTAEVVLNIEQAEYDTDQIDTDHTQNFDKGTLIYWDAASKKFTETSQNNRLAGRVTQAKDSKGVICFILGPQVV